MTKDTMSKVNSNQAGMWLSGRVVAQHTQGPEFDWLPAPQNRTNNNNNKKHYFEPN